MFYRWSKNAHFFAKTSWHEGNFQPFYRGLKWSDDLLKRPLRVKENAVFILDQKTCCIRHPLDLQTDNIAGSFKLSEKERFYECTKSDDSLLLLTEIHVVKEENNVIDGIVNSQIDGKSCKRDAELEHLGRVYAPAI